MMHMDYSASVGILWKELVGAGLTFEIDRWGFEVGYLDCRVGRSSRTSTGTEPETAKHLKKQMLDQVFPWI